MRIGDRSRFDRQRNGLGVRHRWADRTPAGADWIPAGGRIDGGSGVGELLITMHAGPGAR